MGKVKKKESAMKPKAKPIKKKGKMKKKIAKEKKVKEKAEKSSSEDDLRSAVLALGGDQSDIDLIRNVEDDVDDGGGGEVDAEESFSAQARKELEDYIKKLGLSDKFTSGNVAEKDDDDHEDLDEEDSAASSEEDDENESQPNPDAQSSKETVPKKTTSSAKSGDEDDAQPLFHFTKDKSERKYCLVKPGQKWYEVLPSHDSDSAKKVSEYWLPKLEKYTRAIFEQEATNFRSKHANNTKNSEISYLFTVLKSGVLGDKISAHAVLLQDHPVQNLPSFETLLSMISLKSRRPCMLSLDALRDALINHLLVPDRRLKTFAEQPFYLLQKFSGGNKDTRDKYLIIWWFEDRLKELYSKFLAAIDEVIKDTVETTKIKTMSIILELLIANPENEHELLSRLVNKLGDPTRGVAAKAMYQLKKLLEEHPMMKMVVVKEVERVLYRPNIGVKAQYYGICFLSQIILEDDESALANRLIQVYFSFFKASVKKGDINTKLMSALLSGVNRAFPFAKVAKEKLDDQVQVMFRLVHLCSFNTSIQALMLLFQIMDYGESASDRFYATLYRKLLSPELASSNKQAMFLNLLFKAMKHDHLPNRVLAFIKRLLQTCQFMPSFVICGILFLISEVVRNQPSLRQLKEWTQVTSNSLFDSVDLNKFDGDEEHYEDVKEEQGDSDEDEQDSKKNIKENGGAATSSWVHKENLKGNKGNKNSGQYDPFNRNPTFSGAETSVLLELETLSKHFHPSVALFATQLADGKNIQYTGDPLQDFTLSHFLDRFVFRNPKKDPLKGKPVSVLSKRKLYVPRGIKSIAPDSKEYVSRDESSVPEDERFMFTYFKQKREKKLEDVDDENDDNESVTSDDFNAFMDKLAGKRKKGEEDPDIDFAGGIGDLKDFESDEEGEDELKMEALSEEEEESFVEADDNDDVESGPEFEDLEDMQNDNEEEDEFDEEGFEISDNDDMASEEAKPSTSKRARKDRLKKLKKGNSKDLHSLLASAEEFADLIDEHAVNDLDLGGSEAVSNLKDKATKKQLKWEKTRNEAMSGKQWKKFKKNHTGKQKFGKRR